MRLALPSFSSDITLPCGGALVCLLPTNERWRDERSVLPPCIPFGFDTLSCCRVACCRLAGLLVDVIDLLSLSAGLLPGTFLRVSNCDIDRNVNTRLSYHGGKSALGR